MTLELHATPAEVMRAVETLQEFGKELELGEREIFGLALALEECASNIVNHAYQRDSSQIFSVLIQHTGGAIVLELRDHGPEFDPTRAPVVEPTGDEEDRPPGGWGILLVRHYVDEIVYRREKGMNVLLLKKIIAPIARK